MLCPKCDGFLTSGMTYCPSCGYTLKPEELKQVEEEAQESETESISESKHGVNWTLLVVLLLILICLFFTMELIFTERPIVAVQEQLSELRNQRVTEAYFKYASKEFQAIINLDKFRDFVRLYPVLTNQKDFVVQNEKVKNELAYVEGELIAIDESRTPIQYRLIQEDNGWKILNVYLNNVKVSTKAPLPEFTAVIERQIRALRHNDLNAAYKTTSKDFQKETTLDAFRAFVHEYPILTSHRGVEFTETKNENDQVVILGNFIAQRGMVPVEYRMRKENGEWKIWGIKISVPLSDEEMLTATAFEIRRYQTQDDSLQFKVLVKDELDLIRRGEVRRAYQEYSSKAFKETTSIDEFDRFINDNPILRSYKSVELKNPIENKNIVILKGHLISEDSKEVPIEFDLFKEQDGWKVIQIQVDNH